MWRCQQCGEESAGSFDVCHKCGTRRTSESMRPPSVKVVCVLWIVTATAFLGTFITFLSMYGEKLRGPGSWYGIPLSWVAVVTLYCITGWCLIPLPFALAAVVASFNRAAAKPEDTKAMGRGLRIFSWVIGILVLGLAFLFLLFILTSHSSGRGFWRD